VVAALAFVGGTAAIGPAAGSPCAAVGTRALLEAFISAYNAGDGQRLDALFVDASRFKWYSSNEPGTRVNPDANDRGSLLGYFAARHAAGDRLTLVSFSWNGNTGGAEGYGNISFTLRRSAADYQQGMPFGLAGKAAAVCMGQTPQFIVVSLGGPGTGASGPVTPAPPCLATRVQTLATGSVIVRSGPITGYLTQAYDVVSGRFSLHVGPWRVTDRLSQKIPWFVRANAGAGPSIVMTATRLAPLPTTTFKSTFPTGGSGYPQGMVFPSNINPPSAGCWRLTMRTGRVTAGFVVLVRK
jgi:hypothetical protein